MYISDHGVDTEKNPYGRVVKLAENGTEEGEWSMSDGAVQTFSSIWYDGTTTQGGSCALWVADSEKGVLRVSADGTVLPLLVASPTDAADSRTARFTGMAQDSPIPGYTDDSNLVLLDTSDPSTTKVWRYLPYNHSYILLDTTAAQLGPNIPAVAVDQRSHQIFLSDTRTHSVIRLTETGQLDTSWVGTGFVEPAGLCWYRTTNSIFVVDSAWNHSVNGAVALIDYGWPGLGSYMLTATTPPMYRPLSVTLDYPNSQLYVADSAGYIFQFDLNGRQPYTQTFHRPVNAAGNIVSMTVNARGDLYSVDVYSRRLIIMMYQASTWNTGNNCIPPRLPTSSSSSSSLLLLFLLLLLIFPFLLLVLVVLVVLVYGIRSVQRTAIQIHVVVVELIVRLIVAAQLSVTALCRTSDKPHAGRSGRSGRWSSVFVCEEEEGDKRAVEGGQAKRQMSCRWRQQGRKGRNKTTVCVGMRKSVLWQQSRTARCTRLSRRHLPQVTRLRTRVGGVTITTWHNTRWWQWCGRWSCSTTGRDNRRPRSLYPPLSILISQPSLRLPCSSNPSDSSRLSPATATTASTTSVPFNSSTSTSSSASTDDATPSPTHPPGAAAAPCSNSTSSSATSSPPHIAELLSSWRTTPTFISSVTDLTILGEGSSGVVYRGLYRGGACVVKLPKSISLTGAAWREWQCHLSLPPSSQPGPLPGRAAHVRHQLPRHSLRATGQPSCSFSRLVVRAVCGTGAHTA